MKPKSMFNKKRCLKTEPQKLKNTPKNKSLIKMANQLEEFNKNPTKKEVPENLENLIEFRNA